MKRIAIVLVLCLVLSGCSIVDIPNEPVGTVYYNEIPAEDEIMSCEPASCKYWQYCQCNEARDHPIDYADCYGDMEVEMSDEKKDMLLENANNRLKQVGLANTVCDQRPQALGVFEANDGKQIVTFSACRSYPDTTVTFYVGEDIYVCNYKRYE